MQRSILQKAQKRHHRRSTNTWRTAELAKELSPSTGAQSGYTDRRWRAYLATRGNEKHREATRTTKHVDRWAIQPQSLPIQLKERLEERFDQQPLPPRPRANSPDTLVTRDINWLYPVHSGNIKTAPSGYARGRGFDISLVPVYNLNLEDCTAVNYNLWFTVIKATNPPWHNEWLVSGNWTKCIVG